MARAEGIVFALVALAETGKTSGLADRAHATTTTGQDLVGIGLMTYVPDQPVVRRIEDMMQRNSELDYAKACAEMAAGD
jgi:hypothetical protein